MSSPPPAPARHKTSFCRETVPRLLAASLGGYALCWALVSLLCAWLPMAKASRWFLTGQLIPIPLVLTLLWAFAASTVRRALLCPLGLALALQGLAVLR